MTKSAGNAHVIGIAGIGMSAVALLLKEKGWHVTGSDQKIHPPASEILPANGLIVREPYQTTNVPEHVDLFVAGKSAAVTEENPELQVARQRNARVESYAEVLSWVTAGRRRLVVAGSYGKSTTTSMVAWALQGAGVDCGYFIGAQAKNFPTHAHLGTAAPFVLEGDEYPSSHADDRAKFLHYGAEAVLLTSAEHDHVNIYPTHADFLKPFQDLVKGLPANGLMVACADEPHALGVSKTSNARVVTYGASNMEAQGHTHYTAQNIRWGETTTFTLMKNGKALADITTTQLGLHNIQNMVGTAALVLELGLLNPAQTAASLSQFAGVTRRLDRLTSKSPIPVYEGFGSSREKSMSAIAAIKQHFPERRLVVLFEPHTFSWRNREMLHWYDDTFTGVDDLWVYPPPTHIGANTHAQISMDDITPRLAAAGHKPHVLSTDTGENLKTVTAALKPNDVVLILTSGSLNGLISPLVKSLDV